MSVLLSIRNYISEHGLVTFLPFIGACNVANILILLTLLTGILLLCLRKMKPKVIHNQSVPPSTVRFRNRDKLVYYATRFGRKFRQLTNVLKDIKSPQTRRRVIVTFVKRAFKIPNELDAATLDRRRLPESFFEPDEDERDLYPDDLRLITNAIRVFGHLENSLLYRFCEFIQTVNLRSGDRLFRIGEQDDNVYVVQSGKIQFYVIEPDGSQFVISEVTKGDGIDSFLSVLNILTSNSKPTPTTIEAVALEPSCLLKLPIRSFLEVCQPHSPDLLRVLQMTCIRLQRLTFIAICNHLGLATELLEQHPPVGTQSKAVEYFEHLRSASTADIPSQLSTSKSLMDYKDTAALTQNVKTSNCDAVTVLPSNTRTNSTFSNRLRERRETLEFGEAPQRGTFPKSPPVIVGSSQPPLNRKSPQYFRHLCSSDIEEEDEERLLATYQRTHSLDVTFALTDRHTTLTAASVQRRITGGRHSMTSDDNRLLFPGQQPLRMSASDEAELIQKVQEDIARLLEFKDFHLLQDDITLACVPSGTILSRETDTLTEIYFIISGELVAMQSVVRFGTTQLVPVYVFRAGDLAGLLTAVTSEPNICTWRTGTECVLAAISRRRFYAIVRQHPQALFAAVRHLSALASPLLHQLDFAMQWISVNAGKALYKKGDAANHVYVLLSGRLRQVENLSDGGHRVAGEVGRGEFFGHLEVTCSIARVHTVIAIRDSEVAQIPGQLLQYLKVKVPQVMTRLVHLLSTHLLGNLITDTGSVLTGGASHRMSNFLGAGAPGMLHSGNYEVNTGFPAASALAANTHRTKAGVTSAGSEGNAPGGNKSASSAESGTQLLAAKSSMSNLRTVAILPVSGEINAEAFTLELQHSMTPIGPSIRLTSRIIQKRLGPSALKSVNHYRLIAWLGHQEDLHRIVFFVCDCSASSAWNRLCIRQADCVLVLALGNTDPSRPSQMELILKNHPTKVAKALVFMYPSDTDYPLCRHTAKWLNLRPWISHNYHIRCEKRVFSRVSPDQLVAFYEHVFARERPNSLSDFSRLARYLTGEAIGLVLGGGGARGCSHIGVIQAFQEAGIPIDLIGGTSIGAFMGALWAEETRLTQFVQRARGFSTSMASIWNKLKDFTYPAVSIFSGKEFNNQLEKVFGARQVEDLWIPTFLVTTDITNCRIRVHTQGSLWRYVRASMSLSGYLPPLCDPYDGSLLLDGGYTNNVPADIMAAFGAKTIFAVDVGALVDTDFTNYGDHLSGWRLLYHRFFKPYSPTLRVPNLTEIQSRLAYISCVRQLENIKASGICHYLRPPIDRYMTLQFSAFDEIVAVGHEYAKEMIYRWKEEDLLHHLVPGFRANRLLFAPLSPMNCPSQASSNTSSDTDDETFGWIQPFDDQQQPYLDLADSVDPQVLKHRHASSLDGDTEGRNGVRSSPAFSSPSLQDITYGSFSNNTPMAANHSTDNNRRRTLSDGFGLHDPMRYASSSSYDELDPEHHGLPPSGANRSCGGSPRGPSTFDILNAIGCGHRLDHRRTVSLVTSNNSCGKAGNNEPLEDGGYVEDDESDVSVHSYTPLVESEPELNQAILQHPSHRFHKFKPSADTFHRRVRSNSDLSKQAMPRPLDGVSNDGSAARFDPIGRKNRAKIIEGGEQNQTVRQRKFHRRSSLNRLHQKSKSKAAGSNESLTGS